VNAIASDSRYELGSKEVGKWEVGSGFLKLDWELIILLKKDLVSEATGIFPQLDRMCYHSEQIE
jgi:hypothetical protein